MANAFSAGLIGADCSFAIGFTTQTAATKSNKRTDGHKLVLRKLKPPNASVQRTGLRWEELSEWNNGKPPKSIMCSNPADPVR